MQNHFVWCLCDIWVGIQSVHHNNIMKHFLNFNLMELNDKQNKIWQGVWVGIVCMIWNHRNKIIFKQGKVDDEEVFFCMEQLNA